MRGGRNDLTERNAIPFAALRLTVRILVHDAGHVLYTPDRPENRRYRAAANTHNHADTREQRADPITFRPHFVT